MNDIYPLSLDMRDACVKQVNTYVHVFSLLNDRQRTRALETIRVAAESADVAVWPTRDIALAQAKVLRAIADTLESIAAELQAKPQEITP